MTARAERQRFTNEVDRVPRALRTPYALVRFRLVLRDVPPLVWLVPGYTRLECGPVVGTFDGCQVLWNHTATLAEGATCCLE